MGKIWEWFKGLMYDIAETAIAILPDSPLKNWQHDFAGFQKIMGWINYFIPIGMMLDILAAYVGAVLVWYIARWALRFAKYIQ